MFSVFETNRSVDCSHLVFYIGFLLVCFTFQPNIGRAYCLTDNDDTSLIMNIVKFENGLASSVISYLVHTKPRPIRVINLKRYSLPIYFWFAWFYRLNFVLYSFVKKDNSMIIGVWYRGERIIFIFCTAATCFWLPSRSIVFATERNTTSTAFDYDAFDSHDLKEKLVRIV